MNAIKNFAFEDRLVRSVERNGQPWFIGNDVCAALDISQPTSSLRSLDDDEKGVHSVHTLGGDQEMIIVNEPGVYRLVFRSRKPEAERFKRWLAHEVLPALRKNGHYGEESEERFSADTAPLAALRARIDLVREARSIFGPARASVLWRSLGLPDVPSPAAMASDDAIKCLAHLLSCEAGNYETVRTLITQALEDDLEAMALLRPMGIRVVSDMAETEGFIVATSHQGILDVFKGSPWGHLDHVRALRKLPGSITTGPMKFHGPRAARGTFIPSSYLDEEWNSVPKNIN